MKRLAVPILLCASMLSPSLRSARGQDAPGVTLGVPVQGGYDFHDVQPASPAQRLRDAPLPDPSAVTKPSDSQHDPNTGADTTAFGTAYSYPNPLYGTASGENAVANSASRSANVAQPQAGNGGGLVLFEWGYPPPPMPKVPGEDLTAAPPPVKEIRLAVQASDQPVLDAKSVWVLQRAVQSYARAGLVEITIERPSDAPHCCADFPLLVRTELIQSGIGPAPRGLLPGHRIRLVLAAMPASR